MAYTDQTLTCADCGAEFTFTAGEQEFHASKGFTSSPRRCPTCRRARKVASGGTVADSRPPRQMFTVNCASCGQPAQVPFEPRGDRPVYCSNCFTPRPRTGGGGGYGSSGGGGGESDGDDESAMNPEDNVQTVAKPATSEGEEVVYDNRAKVLRYSLEDKEWKDIGTGSLRVYNHAGDKR